jgi:hypothetical protein
MIFPIARIAHSWVLMAQVLACSIVLAVAMEKSLFVRFSSGEVERVLPVLRHQRSRDLQKDLCAAFRARFPAEMAVITTATGKCFDDFETVPFEGVPSEVVEAHATVKFLPTDNPYFYDVRDRHERKVSLEEEMRWEDARSKGAVSVDVDAWLADEGSIALKSLPMPPTCGSGWCPGGPPGIDFPIANQPFLALCSDMLPSGKGLVQPPFHFDLKVPQGFNL